MVATPFHVHLGVGPPSFLSVIIWKTLRSASGSVLKTSISILKIACHRNEVFSFLEQGAGRPFDFQLQVSDVNHFICLTNLVFDSHIQLQVSDANHFICRTNLVFLSHEPTQELEGDALVFLMPVLSTPSVLQLQA